MTRSYSLFSIWSAILPKSHARGSFQHRIKSKGIISRIPMLTVTWNRYHIFTFFSISLYEGSFSSCSSSFFPLSSWNFHFFSFFFFSLSLTLSSWYGLLPNFEWFAPVFLSDGVSLPKLSTSHKLRSPFSTKKERERERASSLTARKGKKLFNKLKTKEPERRSLQRHGRKNCDKQALSILRTEDRAVGSPWYAIINGNR